MRKFCETGPLGLCMFLVPALAGAIFAQELQIRDKTLLEEVEQRILDRVNEERNDEGLNPVTPEPILVEIARRHTREMLDYGFFQHVNLEGWGPGERVSRGHRTLAGGVAENIWKGNRSRDLNLADLAEDIMDGLMNSPGHRKNIMTPEMTHLGLGVYKARGRPVTTNEIIVTQVFAAVRGYTRDPVAESFMRSQTVRFSLKDLEGNPANAQYFDLWSTTDQVAVIDPTPLERARLEVPPGTYQLRFLFNTDKRGRFDAISGPYITVH